MKKKNKRKKMPRSLKKRVKVTLEKLVKVTDVTDGDTVKVQPRNPGDQFHLIDKKDGTLIRRPDFVVIRLNGIDAPEVNQPHGKKARNWLRDRIFTDNGNIMLKYKGYVDDVYEDDSIHSPKEAESVTDKYGRITGGLYIYDIPEPSGTPSIVDIQYEMLRAGHAWWYQKYDKNNNVYRDAMEYARANRLGLWDDTRYTKGEIMNPEDYRAITRFLRKQYFYLFHPPPEQDKTLYKRIVDTVSNLTNHYKNFYSPKYSGIRREKKEKLDSLFSSNALKFFSSTYSEKNITTIPKKKDFVDQMFQQLYFK